MEIGTAIRFIRIELNITQGELARMSSLSQNALSQIETGYKRPGRGTIAKICNALGVPEYMLCIVALQERDLHESRQHAYRIIHPVITGLILQMANKPGLEIGDGSGASRMMLPMAG